MRNVVLVAGGRDFNDSAVIEKALNELHSQKPITKIVQGYARGVDRLADEWARRNNIRSTGDKYRVDSHAWKKLGKKAGILRNLKMLNEETPDVVVAFPGGPGTANMITSALNDPRVDNVFSVTKTGQIKNESRSNRIARLEGATR